MSGGCYLLVISVIVGFIIAVEGSFANVFNLLRDHLSVEEFKTRGTILVMKNTMVAIVGLTTCGVVSADVSLYEETSWVSYERLGVGAQIGTTGIGAHATYDITEYLYLKAEFNTFSYDSEFDLDGADGDGSLELSSFGATLNYNPLRFAPVVDGFRFTAGMYAVDNRVTVEVSDAGESIDVGDVTEVVLDADDVLAGEAAFNSVAPYVGVGWDWMIGSKDQFTFSFDLGALFTGSPEVDVEARGGLTDTIETRAADLGISQSVNDILDDEASAFEEDVDALTIYPVIKLSAGWRF